MNLSKQSKKLMLFFTKNKQLKYVNQTNNTKKILTELYKEILEAFKYISKRNINNNYTIKILKNVSEITKPQNFNATSFPEIVRNHIDKSMMSEICYTFSLYERKIKVYFITETNDIDLNIDVYNKYLNAVAMWLYILNIYSSKECSKKISIYFYLTSLEKVLPKSNIFILDQINVNTAFTTTCPVDSEIVVFRKEEWFKVFIHETFHNFGLDFSMMNNNNVNKCILDIFKVNSEVNGYEAYTEFWAEIINALFCSFYALKDINDMNSFLSNSELFINFEITYSLFQLTKTLDFMGISYNDLFSNSKQSVILRENLYKEKTNVLSYYIIKTILLNNYQGFLSWCNSNNLSLLDFKKTTGNLNEFCLFIQKNYKKRDLLNNIYQTHLFLSKIQRKKENYKYILSNLRMSICELG
jgi:hypothetical protein